MVDLLKSEKGKYDKGKYDGAMAKLKTTFSVLKEKATAMGASGEATLSKLSDLEQQREILVEKLAALESSPAGISASRGVDSNSTEDQAGLLESAESIRQEILRLSSEVESLSQETVLAP